MRVRRRGREGPAPSLVPAGAAGEPPRPRAPASFRAARSFMSAGRRRAPPAGTRSCPRSAARRPRTPAPPPARPAPAAAPRVPQRSFRLPRGLSPPPPRAAPLAPARPRPRPLAAASAPASARPPLPSPAALSQLLAAARTYPLPLYAPVTRAGPAAARGPRAGWEATSRALPPRWKELVGSLRRTFFCLQSLSTTFTAPAPYPSAPSAAALTLVAPRRSRTGRAGIHGHPREPPRHPPRPRTRRRDSPADGEKRVPSGLSGKHAPRGNRPLPRAPRLSQTDSKPRHAA